MLDVSGVRLLTGSDVDAVAGLCARDPVTNAFVASRLHSAGGDPRRLAGELWGYEEDGILVSACHVGANLVPVEATPAAVEAFVRRGRTSGRHCSSIVGPADVVARIWDGVSEAWGPAREVRACQPLMVADGPPHVAPDPAVRPVRPDEVEVLLPASVAMFVEEVGVRPFGREGSGLYRSGLVDLVEKGRSLARIEHGRVVFKAEIGAVTPQVCQVTGVWVDPQWRGRGLAAPGMAAVVEYARREFAPVVSLYVNDFNVRALRAYRRVGFREVGAFATVLF